MKSALLSLAVLAIFLMSAAQTAERKSSSSSFFENLELEKEQFLNSENNKKAYLRLLELERQALQLADDQPLKLGSIGSAILDLYSGSQTGHYAMSIFYDHLDSPDAKKLHKDSLDRIQEIMSKESSGKRDSAYPVMTINDAKTFIRTSSFSPVGAIYRTTEEIELGLLVLGRQKQKPLEYWFFDLSEVLAALEPQSINDESQGWPLIRELANASDSAAQAAIGAYLVNQRKFNSAVSWLNVASRLDNLLANSLLGRAYWSQSRLAKTDKTRQEKLELAQENYLQAIALGSTESMYTLASLYLQNHYGENNEQAALSLLNQAASLNHVESLLYLGQLYNSGSNSVQRNISQANQYFKKAATLGDEAAAIMYGRFLVNQRDTELESGNIVTWLKEHASKENAEAMVILGNLYATGTEVKPSNNAAIRWYKKAVRQDEEDSDIVNEVAWTLTVSDIKGLKRPKYAKKIMDRLMNSSARARSQPEYLDTWAATYAASGDFEKALTLQEQAIDVANRDRIDVIDILREHLELFRDGKTVTEKAP